MHHLLLLLLLLVSGTIHASSIRQLRAGHVLALDTVSDSHNDVNVDAVDNSADWISHDNDAFPTFIEQELETGVDAEAGTETETETETETDADLDDETLALLEQDMAAKADAHTAMDMDMEMEMDADADLEVDMDIDMDMDMDLDNDLDQFREDDLNNAVKAAKLLLGGKLKKSVKKTVTGKACAKNHPINNKPGVCIKSTSCTAAGGVTAKGLCPGDFTIRCCGGNNVSVIIQTQTPKALPSTTPKTLTPSTTTSTTHPKFIKQTVRGKACFTNHPANKKPGVCLKSATCTAAGGMTAKGLCPGDSTILCCGGNNVNVIVQTQAPKTAPATPPAAAAPTPTTSAPVKQTVIGKVCSKNHPSNNKPGVCIKSTSCTAAGGITATGLCPGDSTIRCCGGNNVNVIFQAQPAQAPMAPPASIPVSTTTPIPGTCSYANAPILQIAGNDGIYSVTKILRDHLTDPSSYDMAPNIRDNTMKIDVACRFDEMRSAAATTGVDIKISSGFRTIERQHYFYSCSAAGCCCCNNCNVAAFPGTSNHGFGIALDLNTDCGKQDNIDACRTTSPVYVWLAANAATYGFRRAVLSEPWHWEYHGTGTVATDYT